MKRIIIRSTLIAALAVVSFSFIFAAPIVTAQSTRAEEAQTTAQEKREAAQTTAAEKRTAAETRLADAKLKACQNREEAITNIMTRMGDRGQKHIELFTKISDRVQAFYVDKGSVLSTYDTLVADVNDAKTVAQTAVDTTKAAATEFSCEADDPRGLAEAFKTNLKAQISALNEYKTAVKDLIVGVKSVQSTTVPENNSTEENE